jgi:uncharacterized repeat protein (TIGR03803 family)
MSFRTTIVLTTAILSFALNLRSQDALVATMATFQGTNGSSPYSSLTLGRDGNLYGTTSSGGPAGSGTIFELTSNNTLLTLASFDSTNGAFPPAQLLLSTNGNFYGVTYLGGVYGQGTIFEFSTNHALVSLFSFNGTNGALPWGGLIQASNGNFYGTTSSGGLGFSNGFGGNGTIFMVSPSGVFSNLYSFTGGNDGATPYGTLVQGTNGNLYGTAYSGGSGGAGVIFDWILDPSEWVVFPFNGANGSGPSAGLTLGCDGNLYGTTSAGGTKNAGTIFRLNYAGTLTTLYNFTEIGSDGGTPYSPLLQLGRKLYGTTFSGGLYSNGIIYRLTLSTNPIPCFESLHSFGNLTDGGFPQGGLTEDAKGTLFGTTTDAGAAQGTVYELIKVPRVGHPSLAGGLLSVTCRDVQPGLVYQPQYSLTLTPGSWSNWGPPVTANSNRFVVTGTAFAAEGFVRIQFQPPGLVP